MSLNWNISNVQHYKATCYDRLPLAGNEARLDEHTFFGPDWYVSKNNPDEIERLSATTFTLIFATMSVGLREITSKNVGEFYRRLTVIESTGGLRRGGDGNDVRFTLDEVRAHIGLSTNASTETNKQFDTRMERARLRRAQQGEQDRA